MSDIHMNDTVEFEFLGNVDVSTCNTPDAGWETCLFYADGNSTVVARYCDVERAVLGHQAFLQRDVMRFILGVHHDLKSAFNA